MDNDKNRAMRLATEAGRILLENGAEISRVEFTMENIASAYGVEDRSFFVLSNGIIATGDTYSVAKFIPIKGMQLSKIVDVNQLSRDVTDGKCTVNELETRLEDIRNSGSKPWWELMPCITIGIICFTIIFGGSFIDAFSSLFTGLLLGGFITFAGKHLSRFFKNIVCGFVGAFLCIVAFRLFRHSGMQLNIPNIIIGNIIALVPGVPFTNGMRDLANEDYIAGGTRLLDALIVFFCIALGTVLAFLLDDLCMGDTIMILGQPVYDSTTSIWYVQMMAAFLGTLGFSALFGAPRKYYVICGLVGMIGWATYIFSDSIWFASMVVAIVSHLVAVMMRCPVTVPLICGIIPLVPGGGLFWSLYYLLGNHLRLAFDSGVIAVKATIAIAGGIILGAAIFDRLLKKKRKVKNFK